MKTYNIMQVLEKIGYAGMVKATASKLTGGTYVADETELAAIIKKGADGTGKYKDAWIKATVKDFADCTGPIAATIPVKDLDEKLKVLKKKLMTLDRTVALALLDEYIETAK